MFISKFNRRVRKELEEQGILDPNDEDAANVDGDPPKESDEIYEELLRCQVSIAIINLPAKIS
jgi:hypothetical protein